MIGEKLLCPLFVNFVNFVVVKRMALSFQMFNSVCGIIIHFFFNKSLDSLDCKLFVKCLFIY